MSWYKKLLPSQIRTTVASRRVPEGLWDKCKQCSAVLYRPELEKNLSVCSQCGFHMQLNARRRLNIFLDKGGYNELGTDILPLDFLQFKDRIKYKDRISDAKKNTGESDALIVMVGNLHGQPIVAVAFEFAFIGGSMGAVVGERFTKGVEHCLQHRMPLVCFSASGGARMQEALVSLFQMSKVSVMLALMAEQKLPFISVLLNPTMGGVSASLAMLGDVIIAEPKALIGFAGPRVIKQTVREDLPEGFQRSEFLLQHGAIDLIIPRPQLRNRIANILGILHH